MTYYIFEIFDLFVRFNATTVISLQIQTNFIMAELLCIGMRNPFDCFMGFNNATLFMSLLGI